MESYIESYNLPKRKDNFVTVLGAGRKEGRRGGGVKEPDSCSSL